MLVVFDIPINMSYKSAEKLKAVQKRLPHTAEHMLAVIGSQHIFYPFQIGIEPKQGRARGRPLRKRSQWRNWYFYICFITQYLDHAGQEQLPQRRMRTVHAGHQKPERVFLGHVEQKKGADVVDTLAVLHLRMEWVQSSDNIHACCSRPLQTFRRRPGMLWRHVEDIWSSHVKLGRRRTINNNMSLVYERLLA